MNTTANIGKSILKWVGIVLGAIVLIAFLIVVLLTVTEYRPKDETVLSARGSSAKQVESGSEYTALSWNIGYGALGDYADFFMDGGSHVSTSTASQVKDNMASIVSVVKNENPDIMFFQEVDVSSKRSHYIDETDLFMDSFDGYSGFYAPNYKVLYVPYPFPTIGKVNCGLFSMTDFDVSESKRISLPCPFKYPVRLCNLKRCLNISRSPVAGSDKELVMVNIHLEAYDSGEGKIQQTEMLNEILEEEALKGNYVIAAGDFNQYFSTVDLSPYPQKEGLWEPSYLDVSDFGSNLNFYADSSKPSCRSLDKPLTDSNRDGFQYYIIDGFIVSSNVYVISNETLDCHFKNSDHNPIKLVFKLS